MANAPQSRKEAYLAAIAGVPGIDKPMTPQSREEEYLGLIADHVINNDVIANPTLAGTEANLTSVQIDGTKYTVPQGTPVTANPTLAGGETALTGLQVGETKYAVPQGGSTHSYQHNISVGYSDMGYFSLVTNSEVPFTKETLFEYLKSFIPTGYGYAEKISATGYFTANSQVHVIYGLRFDRTSTYAVFSGINLSTGDKYDKGFNDSWIEYDDFVTEC